MGEREKIAQIIAEHLCPQGKAHKTLYGAERMCYSRNNFADCEKVSECVDALLAANIGDATEWKERAGKHRVQVLPDGTIKQLYSDEEVEDIARQRDEYKHCAEIAERALLLMARGECTFASPEFYKEEAEKEIAMEEQIMANRCEEGKCEYFESIRRAANNNLEDGYCKKYKRRLLSYDWWWLKCDECTAEKELAEEKQQ